MSHASSAAASISLLGHIPFGIHDIACPVCGPSRRSPSNQRRKVLRTWRSEPDFAGYACVRCGERGYIRDGSAPRPDQITIERVKAEATQRDHLTSAQRLSTARWLWSQRRPIVGSIAETYLREARGYNGPLPATLGLLPARGKHGPAMIAAFGITTEPEPGVLAIADDAVRGVHLTRIASDGSGKAGTDADKIMLGPSLGSPIVLAPANDLLGLAISEGIEDALSIHKATGLGAWAAGSACRLPALAHAVPEWIDFVTIFADDDDDETGRRNASDLAARLTERRINTRIVLPADFKRAAS